MIISSLFGTVNVTVLLLLSAFAGTVIDSDGLKMATPLAKYVVPSGDLRPSVRLYLAVGGWYLHMVCCPTRLRVLFHAAITGVQV